MSEEETNETIEPTPEVVSRAKADIGYFDGEIKTIAFNVGDNLQTLINKADLNFGDGQSLSDEEGNDVDVTAQAEANKTYYITGNYKQGKTL